MLSLKGTISINRVSNGPRSDRNVIIRIEDAASHCVAVEVEMSAEAFADALFRSEAECSIAVNDSGVLGAAAENKTELVPFECYGQNAKHPDDDYRTPAAVAALAPFEVDGWVGRASDLFNGHRQKRGGSKLLQEVVFYRHVRDGKPV